MFNIYLIKQIKHFYCKKKLNINLLYINNKEEDKFEMNYCNNLQQNTK